MSELANLKPIRGEVHTSVESEDAVRSALSDAGVPHITVNATRIVGHILHEKAAELTPVGEYSVSL